jgi:hypothetical protein
MRLWSLHPKYLDQQGLCGLWRESLLAQRILQAGPPWVMAYGNHPQLDRFKPQPKQFFDYLATIYAESKQRGYKFDGNKIIFDPEELNKPLYIPITTEQLTYEFRLLKSKIIGRAPGQWKDAWEKQPIKAHPIFTIVPGKIEPWERPKQMTVQGDK